MASVPGAAIVLQYDVISEYCNPYMIPSRDDIGMLQIGLVNIEYEKNRIALKNMAIVIQFL